MQNIDLDAWQIAKIFKVNKTWTNKSLKTILNVFDVRYTNDMKLLFDND
jgi:hypothetical protein